MIVTDRRHLGFVAFIHNVNAIFFFARVSLAQSYRLVWFCHTIILFVYHEQ